jgi:hypothetical protein
MSTSTQHHPLVAYSHDAPQFPCTSPTGGLLHTPPIPTTSSCSFFGLSPPHCGPYSTRPSVATPWLVHRTPPIGVPPTPGSARSVSSSSSPLATFNSRAPLLPSPLPFLAPVRPPMPSHRTGCSSTSGGVYGSS